MPSRLTPAEDAIIQAAARANHAYYAMVRGVGDDRARRHAMFARWVAIAAELRGDTAPASPPMDLTIPLEDAVSRQLEAERPRVRAALVLQRETRRTAIACGPVQLELAVTPEARRKLKAIVRASQLSLREISTAIGVSESTLNRHVRGDDMSRQRRAWYHNLEQIFVEGLFIHIIVRRTGPTKKRWGWNLSRLEKDRLIAGMR